MSAVPAAPALNPTMNLRFVERIIACQPPADGSFTPGMKSTQTIRVLQQQFKQGNNTLWMDVPLVDWSP